MLEKTLVSPLDSKEIKPSILKEINPEYSWKGLMLKLKYFNHLMQRADSLEKILMLGKIEGKGEGWVAEDEINSITDSMGVNFSKLRQIVKDRGKP